MSRARAGTTAVVGVLGAAALLLVLVTWAASIGPGQVISAGDVERVQEPESTVPAQPVSPSGQVEGGDEQGTNHPDSTAGSGVVALVLEGLALALLLYVGVRLSRRLRQAWRQPTRQ